MPNDHIRRLDEIGFRWKRQSRRERWEENWEERFTELIAYKNKHGNCSVPQNWPENRKLGNWVTNQRHAYSTNKLAEDRIRRLDEIGFKWKGERKTRWIEMFAEFAAYKDQHGNCSVPQNWPENPKLANWVQKQRRLYNAKKLAEDRTRRLDEIGFRWSDHHAGWEEMFAELVAYKNRFGNCKVPYLWPENPKLGIWASKQRRLYNTNKLAEDRIRRLDEIGFKWVRQNKRAKSE